MIVWNLSGPDFLEAAFSSTVKETLFILHLGHFVWNERASR